MSSPSGGKDNPNISITPKPSGQGARPSASQTGIVTVLPVLGGILVIVGASINLVFNRLLVDYPMIQNLGSPINVLAILILAYVLPIFAIVAAILAFQRRHYGIALAGGVCGVAGLGILTALAGVVLIAMARKEFS